jgi:hypothetical protein
MAARPWALLGALGCALLVSCGGESAEDSLDNVQDVVVDSGPTVNGTPVGAFNMPFVSVTVCSPGDSSRCQTVDHVLLDTGSSGLRLVASALKDVSALPPVTTATGKAVAECGVFVSSFTWGSVRKADVQLSGESAPGISIEVIGDPSMPGAPSDCAATGGTPVDSVDTLAAKGILGIGNFIADCGAACEARAIAATYYSCSANACDNLALAVAQQVSNPVAFFAKDNNGVVIDLPRLAPGGQPTARGKLIFGIGTRKNNDLGDAVVQTLDPATGDFSTTYNGKTFSDSFIDSGSTALLFADDAVALCNDNSGFYCPPAALTLSATNQGLNGKRATVSFELANATTVFDANPSYTAFDDVGVTTADFSAIDGFDWGLPFFFGRRVYTAIEQRKAGPEQGPFVAY